MSNKNLEDGIDQMLHLCYEIEHIYDVGKYLYEKGMNVQVSNPKEFTILVSAASYNFRYLLIRFAAFVDAYMETVNLNISREKAKKVKELLKAVDLKKIEMLRNEILAHHYSKKVKGGYESVISKLWDGQYQFGSGSLSEYEHLKTTVHGIVKVIYAT